MNRLGWSLSHVRPDVVIHAAGYLGVQKTERNPEMCLEINIDGTRIVRRACDLAGIRQLIYFSSSEVYGNATEIPTSETAATHPRSVYAVSKLAAECWVKSGPTPWTIIRPFNVYGPGQRDDFVIPTFIHQALAGKPCTVYGDGMQVRSFGYVTDLCHAVEACLLNPQAIAGTFNIGSDVQPVSMSELAYEITKIVRADGVAVQQPEKIAYADRAPEREISMRVPCTDKAFNLLGWQPDVSLQDGLERTVQFELYRRNNKSC